MMINNSPNISKEAKAEAYDKLCEAYISGLQMDFSLFGRRKSGFNSVSEYVGYAFGNLALRNGSIIETQESLPL